MTNNSSTTIFLFILMAVAFYFLMIRPQRKRQKKQQETIAALVPGSRVMLSSGIYATLVEMRGSDADVELAPGVVVTVVRQAVAQSAPVVEEESYVDTDAQPSHEADIEPLDPDAFSAENLSPDDFRDPDDGRDFGPVHPRSSGSQEQADAFQGSDSDAHGDSGDLESSRDIDDSEPVLKDPPVSDENRRTEGN